MFFEGRRAVVDGVGGGVYLAPLRFLELVDADVVLLFCYVLDAAEEEEVLVEAHHRVTSSWLNRDYCT